MYLTYTSEIFPDLRRKKEVFVDQCVGLFLVELGLFCHFVPGLLAIALGPKPSPVTRIAGIGLGTRLWSVFWEPFSAHCIMQGPEKHLHTPGNSEKRNKLICEKRL